MNITMRRLTLPLLLLFSLAASASSGPVHCSASIERPSDDKSQLQLEDMVLQVLKPAVGEASTSKVIETFPCTPDGNCFALVNEDSQRDGFSLRVEGPMSARFEPREIKIGGKGGLTSCEDLTFILKGYGVTVPVKFLAADGSHLAGPAGVPIKLSDQNPDGFRQVVETNEAGLAIFDEVPNVRLGAYFNNDVKVGEDGGLPLYKVNKYHYQIAYDKRKGFVPLGDEGFVIESTLLEGYVKE